MKSRLTSIGIKLIIPTLFIILWELIATSIGNQIILPKFTTILSHLLNPLNNFIKLGSLPKNIAFSLVRVLIGYSIGVLIAVPLGLLMGYKKNFRKMFETFFSLFKPIPPLAWQPLVLAWFGISSCAKLFGLKFGAVYVIFDNFKLSMFFLIALGTFFPVLFNTIFGVRNVRNTLIESAKVLGASEKDIFFKVLLPAAAPTIVNGMRLGLATAWACLVGAEMLPGSLAGIGYMIIHAYELARTDIVITGMICIGVVGAGMDGIFSILNRKYFSWQSKTK